MEEEGCGSLCAAGCAVGCGISCTGGCILSAGVLTTVAAAAGTTIDLGAGDLYTRWTSGPVAD